MPRIQVKNTSDYTQDKGVKVLVYGMSGSGKTHLCKTAPRPIIISAESGLLTLHRENIPYIDIHSTDQLKDVWAWIDESEEAKAYDTICLDSISEICEVSLDTFKTKESNKQMAYLKMQEEMKKILRAFRDIEGKNVYFSSKMDKTLDAEGNMMFAPSLPNKTIANDVPYFFDEVFAIRTESDEKGTKRWLQTAIDNRFIAKDRSGCLDKFEPLDLSYVFDKIRSGSEYGKAD